MKAQNVRLLDVFVLGPLMMYLSLKGSPMNNFERKALSVIGMATIVYNWRNYKAQAALEAEAPLEIPVQVAEALDFISQSSP